MKTILKNILYCTLVLCIIACSKDDGTNTEEDINTQEGIVAGIYVVGYSNNKAVYWKSDEQITLPSGEVSQATGIYITSTNDIYISGFEKNNNTFWKPIYWKNGEKVSLTTNDIDTYANDIAVANNGDVYVVGREVDENNITTAVYWKNGIKTQLSSSTSIANSIHINANNDVYISGNRGLVPVYWENGTEITLPFDSSLSEAATSSIYVTDTEDIYISGFEKGPTVSWKWRAIYWKNGQRIILPQQESIKSATTSSIYIHNNTIHIVGYEEEEGATFWKNNKTTLTPDVLGVGSAVTVFNNDVYIAGFDFNHSNNTAVYWKNGFKTTLTDISGFARATDIAVIKP